MQRILNLEISHRTEERNAIIDFFDQYCQWRYALLEIHYAAYDRSKLEDLKDKRIHVEYFFAKTSVAHAKLRLLVKSDEIIQLSHQLFVALIEFKGWMQQRLLELQHNLETQEYLRTEYTLLYKNYELNQTALTRLAIDEKKYDLERKKLVTNFNDNRNSENDKIIPLDVQFTELVKDYLTK
ncbi:MAG: hypothetical protein IPN14_02380 [Bacteroidetes bacterium]|nr:hypothetical protein [Bacteroidota bacterium]